MKPTGPTNIYQRQLIETLKKKSFELDAPIWRVVAEKLGKQRRQKVEVNLSHIDKNTAAGDTVVVPGIVLGDGSLSKSVTIVAWKFSEQAKEKIEEAKSKIVTIEELMKENPKGTNVKILV